MVDVSGECEEGLAAVFWGEVWFPGGVALGVEVCEFFADGHEVADFFRGHGAELGDEDL